MEAQALFLKNFKEVKKAEEQGVDPPKEEYIYGDALFNVHTITFVHKDESGDIVIYIQSYRWTLKYSDELWNILKQHLAIKTS